MSTSQDETRLHGLVAEFPDSETLMAAANGVREAGYSHTDAYTPFPVHGLDEALGMKPSPLPWIVLGAGLAGCIGGFLLQWWISVQAYPLNVGGKPMFSWPSFIPVTFECTILAAGLASFLAMLIMNGLPEPYHPVFDAENFERASQDGFFLCVEAEDPAFDGPKTRELLMRLGAQNISEVSRKQP